MKFEELIKQINTRTVNVIDTAFVKSDYVPLDLSKKNEELKEVNVSSSDDLGVYVNEQIIKLNGKVAYGGYIETRNIYQRSTYFNEQLDASDERNIHLGLDIWIDAGTNVLSALDGKVHSFNNNTNHGDYGPTIILEHQLDEIKFFTLYGHLSIESLSDLAVGMNFHKGSVLAQLGSAEVNGDYPSHLHFQIILDMEDYKGDYPGVSSLNTLEFYQKNCPDPNLLLGLEN